MKYNKLVRDKIPQIIKEQTGNEPQIKILNDEEYILALKDKLIEEAHEFKKAKTKIEHLEEMADVMEVINTIISHLDIRKSVAPFRKSKLSKKGGFKDRVFLISDGEVEKTHVTLELPPIKLNNPIDLGLEYKDKIDWEKDDN